MWIKAHSFTPEEGEGAMAEFTLGAAAHCSDGFCGEVSRTILDPAARTVTHLVIQPRHRSGSGRLVPVHLVDEAAGEIRLHVTPAQVDRARAPGSIRPRKSS